MTIPFTHIDRLYIDGQWVAPQAGQEAVINPATGAVIGQAPLASVAQVEAAIAAARHAFDHGPWPTMSMDERANVMQRIRTRGGSARGGGRAHEGAVDGTTWRSRRRCGGARGLCAQLKRP